MNNREVNNREVNNLFFAENTSHKNTLQYLIIYKLLLYYRDINRYFYNLHANTY